MDRCGGFVFNSPCILGSHHIAFSPADQNVSLGESVFVDLTISGLGDASAPSLGVFDLYVSYDARFLGFSNALFGDAELGDPLDFSGYGADYSAVIHPWGAVYHNAIHLYGLSYDTPDTLETLQADSFTLN